MEPELFFFKLSKYLVLLLLFYHTIIFVMIVNKLTYVNEMAGGPQ